MGTEQNENEDHTLLTALESLYQSGLQACVWPFITILQFARKLFSIILNGNGIEFFSPERGKELNVSKKYLTLPAAVPRMQRRELFSSSNESKVDDTEKVNFTQVVSQHDSHVIQIEAQRNIRMINDLF